MTTPDISKSTKKVQDYVQSLERQVATLQDNLATLQGDKTSRITAKGWQEVPDTYIPEHRRIVFQLGEDQDSWIMAFIREGYGGAVLEVQAGAMLTIYPRSANNIYCESKR